MSTHPRTLLLITLLAGTVTLRADWAQVTSLDLPVTKLSPNPAKAKAAMEARFNAQIAANEAFLKSSPDDPHAYEAKVRLAVAQARLGSLRQDSVSVDASLKNLMELEKQAPTPELKAEAMFRRISLQWQNLGNDPDLRRDRAVTSARNFTQEFPKDPRGPRLLAEAASLCDNHPEQERPLVEQALSLTKEESLTLRLKDDLKRLDQLGKPLDLTFKSFNDGTVDLSAYHGKVVALVFWAAESAPSLIWMRGFTSFADKTPGLVVVGVSLDQDKSDLEGAIKALRISWPVAFDGKGWQNPIARRFGINTLPTLWLLDKEGRLQTLNARDNYEFRVNELLRKN